MQNISLLHRRKENIENKKISVYLPQIVSVFARGSCVSR